MILLFFLHLSAIKQQTKDTMQKEDEEKENFLATNLLQVKGGREGGLAGWLKINLNAHEC